MYRSDEEPGADDPLRNGEVSPDDAFRILADSHRRILVTSLLGSDHGVAVDTLIEDVLVHADLSGEPAEVRGRVAAQLHHVHLPKLADAGFVEWERDHDIVTPTEQLGALEPLVGRVALGRFYR